MALKRKRTFGSVIFSLLATVAAVALLIAYLALFLNPADHPVVMFFGLYFIPILLICVLASTIIMNHFDKDQKQGGQMW